MSCKNRLETEGGKREKEAYYMTMCLGFLRNKNFKMVRVAHIPL